MKRLIDNPGPVSGKIRQLQRYQSPNLDPSRQIKFVVLSELPLVVIDDIYRLIPVHMVRLGFSHIANYRNVSHGGDLGIQSASF